MLCQRLRSCTPNICSQKGQVYSFYHIHFTRCLLGFALSCFFFVIFLFYTCSFFACCLDFWFFNFCKHFFATTNLYCVHFPCCWVCVVFLLSTCSFPTLLIGFLIFGFYKHFFYNNPLVSWVWKLNYNHEVLLPQLLGVTT